jgi:D-proline reductase (dithiol) PrdB
MQTAILRDTLELVVSMEHPGEMRTLPYEYRHNV